MKKKIKKAEELIENTYSDSAEVICAKANEMKDKLIDVQETVSTYAKDNPIKTIGFSLLAGAIVAQIFRSRK